MIFISLASACRGIYLGNIVVTIEQTKEEVKVIALEELFADFALEPQEIAKPVPTKLKTALKQLNLGMSSDSVTRGNDYLERLIGECHLFLPEVKKWQNYWDCCLAYKVEDFWLRFQLDLFLSENKELVILDWSGREHNPLLPLQVYLLCLKLNLPPSMVRTVGLISTPLSEERRINFKRISYYSNDLVIARQTLEDALESMGNPFSFSNGSDKSELSREQII